ncbi:MAG: hypothetical protein M3235_01670 [Actinomycetota bacterium]|nr:hypothetical protein [Actinomycetota bacterium]
MTTYAHDAVARTIVAVWTTGAGSAACRVARVPTSTGDPLARHIAQALDRLSMLVWGTYADPGPELRPEALERCMRRPNLPVSDLLRIADDPLEEAAHAVGRLLAEAGSPTMVDAVVRELRADCAAVRAAERGELTGRAQQAVGVCRWVAPDVQVARAHALLHAIPLGSERLFTEVEPTAAAVAAIDWLHAAAAVTSALTGHGATDVLALADALDGKVRLLAARVLQLCSDGGGRAALDVIHDLLSGAFLAGDGVLRAGPRLERAVVAESGAVEPDAEVEGFGDLVDVENLVTTVVHPKDPGRNLLEGLIMGIQGCFEVYLDEITERERPDPDPRLTGPHWAEEIRQRFDAEVRATVAPAGAA